MLARNKFMANCNYYHPHCNGWGHVWSVPFPWRACWSLHLTCRHPVFCCNYYILQKYCDGLKTCTAESMQILLKMRPCKYYWHARGICVMLIPKLYTNIACFKTLWDRNRCRWNRVGYVDKPINTLITNVTGKQTFSVVPKGAISKW